MVRPSRISAFFLFLVTSLDTANATCPLPSLVTDTAASVVIIRNEADLNVLGEGCEVLDANLAIILVDATTNFTLPGLRIVNGFMSVVNSPFLQRFQFPDLEEVNGDWLEIGQLPMYSEYDSFPRLRKVKMFNINFTPRLTLFDQAEMNGTIRQIDQIVFNNTGLTNISLSQVQSTDGLSLQMLNNAQLRSFTMPYTGHSNASISCSGQPRNATFAFPYLTQLDTLKLNGLDGGTIAAPQLESVRRLEMTDMSTSLPDTQLLREVELLFVANSKLKALSLDKLTRLKHLVVANTTVASDELNLPVLNTMNVPGTIPPSELNVQFPWPPGSSDLNTLSFPEWQGIYLNNSELSRVNIPSLQALSGSVELTQMPCFNCKKLLEDLYAADLKPKECFCESICGVRQTFYVTPSNWTDAEKKYGLEDDDKESKHISKAPIIGGAVGGGVALILLAVLGVLLCRRRRERHMLRSIPEEAPAPPPAPAPAPPLPPPQAPMSNVTSTTDHTHWGVSELVPTPARPGLKIDEKPAHELEGPTGPYRPHLHTHELPTQTFQIPV